MGYGYVLVTLDGSILSESAMGAALAVSTPNTKLHLLSVIDDSAETNVPLIASVYADFALQSRRLALSKEASIPRQVATRLNYLDSIKDRLACQGYNVTTEACVGRVAETILDAASTFDLLVMATHGRSGLKKFIIGSVAEAVLHKVSCPLLITPAGGREDARYNCILVSLDGSARSEAILPEVEKLLSIHPCKIVLVRVEPYAELSPIGLTYDDYTVLRGASERESREYLEGIVARFERFGATPVIEVNFNTPDKEIPLLAKYHGADLIAMATHGRTGLNRFVHGSVTEHTLHSASRPMLIVRPG